jgi:hypothetical protein
MLPVKVSEAGENLRGPRLAYQRFFHDYHTSIVSHRRPALLSVALRTQTTRLLDRIMPLASV